MPSRVIDVRAEETSDCRLVVLDPASPPSDTRYIALSYCWGDEAASNVQFRTEKANLSDRQRGFMLPSVTPVLRDAVEVARVLDIPYLWIDALCIVQDDLQDWAAEAAKMSLVYGNAWLTICAANSTSCLESFLKRPAENSMSIEFSSRLNPCVRGEAWLRFHAQAEGRNCDHLYLDFQASPWMKRGWTFQELTLSRHLLIFGKHKMYYKTVDWIHLEGDDVHKFDRTTGYSFFDLEAIRDGDKTGISGWLDVTELFSSRTLTRQTDRLPAIAGLARIAAENRPNAYLAGIRRDFAYRDLMWAPAIWEAEGSVSTISTVIQSLEAPEHYIAPSWSWASRPFELFHPGLQVDDMFFANSVSEFRTENDSLDAETLLAGANLYGEVRGGVMVITGAVVPIPVPLLQPVEDSFWKVETRLFRIGSQGGARILLDWTFDDSAECTQDLSLVLLGSCLPLLDDRSVRRRREFRGQIWNESRSETTSSSGLSYSTENPNSSEKESAEWTEPGGTEEYQEGPEHAFDCMEEIGSELDETTHAPDDVRVESSNTPIAYRHCEDAVVPSGCLLQGHRMAFGIVAYPSRTRPGQYLRVGTWTGFDCLDHLRAQEPVTIEFV